MFSDKRRGDIWWMVDTHRKPADTCLIRGDRPVIVVSSDSANQTGSTATVVPMTSSPARLARGDGFCDNVLLLGYGEPSMALPRQVLLQTEPICSSTCLGHLTDADMRRLDAALRSALGL